MKISKEGDVITSVKFQNEYYESVKDVIVDVDGNIVILNEADFPPDYIYGLTLTKLSPSL